MDGHARLERQLVDCLRRNLAGGRVAVPEAGVLIWNLFMEISSSRTFHQAGPNPISFSEISEYARLYRWPLQPHHIEIIRALDDAWLKHAYTRNGSSANGGSSLPPSTSQAINPAAFDAVFG